LIFSENKIIYESRLLPELLIGKTISVEEAPQALMNMNKFENLDDMVINSFLIFLVQLIELYFYLQLL
jgi:hypothetical protein